MYACLQNFTVAPLLLSLVKGLRGWKYFSFLLKKKGKKKNTQWCQLIIKHIMAVLTFSSDRKEIFPWIWVKTIDHQDILEGYWPIRFLSLWIHMVHCRLVITFAVKSVEFVSVIIPYCWTPWDVMFCIFSFFLFSFFPFFSLVWKISKVSGLC